MSGIDQFLRFLIKRLQKVQKSRQRKKKRIKRVIKASQKAKSKRSPKRSSKIIKRTQAKRKKRANGRPAKRILKKPSKVKKKQKKGLKSASKKKKKKTIKKTIKTKNIPAEIFIGEVTHYFSNIQVIVIKIIKGKISVGDQIHIKGRSTDFNQKVKSLQIESIDVRSAKKGQLAGLKVKQRARPGDQIFKQAA